MGTVWESPRELYLKKGTLEPQAFIGLFLQHPSLQITSSHDLLEELQCGSAGARYTAPAPLPDWIRYVSRCACQGATFWSGTSLKPFGKPTCLNVLPFFFLQRAAVLGTPPGTFRVTSWSATPSSVWQAPAILTLSCKCPPDWCGPQCCIAHSRWRGHCETSPRNLTLINWLLSLY